MFGVELGISVVTRLLNAYNASFELLFYRAVAFLNLASLLFYNVELFLQSHLILQILPHFLRAFNFNFYFGWTQLVYLAFQMLILVLQGLENLDVLVKAGDIPFRFESGFSIGQYRNTVQFLLMLFRIVAQILVVTVHFELRSTLGQETRTWSDHLAAVLHISGHLLEIG